MGCLLLINCFIFHNYELITMNFLNGVVFTRPLKQSACLLIAQYAQHFFGFLRVAK
jgi:hypothetical protein